MHDFVSRAGHKLQHAFEHFKPSVSPLTAADFGSNTGGFVDCLLQHGFQKVYAIETGYGVLDYKLRKDPRVVVKERTNAMHVQLPELVPLITIDVSWTRQKNILPSAYKNLLPDGQVISLIKPHYEANASQLRKGILMPEYLESVIQQVSADILPTGFEIIGMVPSPILGAKGNIECLAFLKKK